MHLPTGIQRNVYDVIQELSWRARRMRDDFNSWSQMNDQLLAYVRGYQPINDAKVEDSPVVKNTE